jgi:hypothetical protein
MGVPASEVGYASAKTGRGDHEVHKGHVVALGGDCCVYSIPHVLQTEVYTEMYCMIHSGNITAVGGFVQNVKV